MAHIFSEFDQQYQVKNLQLDNANNAKKVSYIRRTDYVIRLELKTCDCFRRAIRGSINITRVN